MTDPIQHLRELMAKATPLPHMLTRYDHGGGRLFVYKPERTLIADFFDENNRELFVTLRSLAPQLLEVVEAARCIRHWHDAMADGSGMVVSAEHVRKLWEALAALGGKGE